MEDDGLAGARERLRVAYVPIACAAPLLHAAACGVFERYGLSVELHKAPSWDMCAASTLPYATSRLTPSGAGVR